MQERLAERVPTAPAGAVAQVGKTASLPSGNSGPPPRIEDGSAEQADVLREAVKEARRMAVVGLGLLRVGAATEAGRRLLETHFHTTDAALLGRANQVLAATLTGMNGELPIEVEASSQSLRGPVRGYVFGGPFAPWSDIHLTPLFFAQSPREQGATILHESTHKFAGTVDHAYWNTKEYEHLTPEDAVENADSYAMFCRAQLNERLLIEDEKQRRKIDEAVRSHGEDVWRAWETGNIVLGHDGFTTSDGVELPIGVVKGIILERFTERFPSRYEDIVRYLEAKDSRYTLVVCGDGFKAPEDLVRLIGDQEAL